MCLTNPTPPSPSHLHSPSPHGYPPPAQFSSLPATVKSTSDAACQVQNPSPIGVSDVKELLRHGCSPTDLRRAGLFESSEVSTLRDYDPPPSSGYRPRFVSVPPPRSQYAPPPKEDIDYDPSDDLQFHTPPSPSEWRPRSILVDHGRSRSSFRPSRPASASPPPFERSPSVVRFREDSPEGSDITYQRGSLVQAASPAIPQVIVNTLPAASAMFEGETFDGRELRRYFRGFENITTAYGIESSLERARLLAGRLRKAALSFYNGAPGHIRRDYDELKQYLLAYFETDMAPSWEEPGAHLEQMRGETFSEFAARITEAFDKYESSSTTRPLLPADREFAMVQRFINGLLSIPTFKHFVKLGRTGQCPKTHKETVQIALALDMDSVWVDRHRRRLGLPSRPYLSRGHLDVVKPAYRATPEKPTQSVPPPSPPTQQPPYREPRGRSRSPRRAPPEAPRPTSQPASAPKPAEYAIINVHVEGRHCLNIYDPPRLVKDMDPKRVQGHDGDRIESPYIGHDGKYQYVGPGLSLTREQLARNPNFLWYYHPTQHARYLQAVELGVINSELRRKIEDHARQLSTTPTGASAPQIRMMGANSLLARRRPRKNKPRRADPFLYECTYDEFDTNAFPNQPSHASFLGCRINGRPSWVIPDSGAEISIIPVQFAHYLSITGVDMDTGPHAGIVVYGGDAIEVVGLATVTFQFGTRVVTERVKLVSQGEEILIGTPLLLRARLSLNFANGTHLRVFDGDTPLRTAAHGCMVHAVNYVGTPRPGHSRIARCKSEEVIPPRSVVALPVVVPKSLEGQLVVAVERGHSTDGSALIPRGVHRVRKGHIRVECVNSSSVPIPLPACTDLVSVIPVGRRGSEFTRLKARRVSLNSPDSTAKGDPHLVSTQPSLPVVKEKEDPARDDDAAPIGLDLPLELPTATNTPTSVPEYDLMTYELFQEHLQGLLDAGKEPEDIFGLDLGEMEHLTPQQQVSLRQLLTACKAAFASTKTELGRTHLVEHRMETFDAAPIKQRPHRVPFTQRQIIETEVKKMLQTGAIYPSKSPWASPVVLAVKKDGDIRFGIDYRLVNDVTKKDVYPLPRIDDTLDLLTGACWFSSLV